MEILPGGEINLLGDAAIRGAAVEHPSRTYRLDIERGRIAGYTDGKAAMEQAIFKMLQTWLFAHDIYDDQYGFQARGLLGKKRPYIYSELKRRIKETLMVDGRIIEVYAFEFIPGIADDALTVRFSVRTRFGDFKLAKELTLI